MHRQHPDLQSRIASNLNKQNWEMPYVCSSTQWGLPARKGGEEPVSSSSFSGIVVIEDDAAGVTNDIRAFLFFLGCDAVYVGTR